MSEPTIADAKKLATAYRKRGVIVLSFEGGQFAAASYGMTRRDCDAMREVVNQICDRIAAGEIEVPE